MKQRLAIDWTRCEGRGLCIEIVPELLTEDDWGYPLARGRDTSPVVTPAVMTHARRAVAECPRLALSLRPDST